MIVTMSRTQPQYDLYIQRRTKAMKLIDRRTGCAVPLSDVTLRREGAALSSGIFVYPSGAITAFLMSDEIHVVEELP